MRWCRKWTLIPFGAQERCEALRIKSDQIKSNNMISSGEKLTTNRGPVLFQRFNVCTEIKSILILNTDYDSYPESITLASTPLRAVTLSDGVNGQPRGKLDLVSLDFQA